MFVVGTETDHVAPWKSVYKVRRQVRSNDYTFLLTSGGHNAGIVSGPVHPKRKHRVRTETQTDTPLDAADWFEFVQPQTGSWWPVWQSWLAARSGERVPPPEMGDAAQRHPALGAAPGSYVHG